MSTCSMLVSRFSTEQRLEASHSCNPQFVEVHLTQGILQCLKRIYLMFPLLCVWIILIPRDLKIWVVDSSQFPRFGFSYKMMLSSMVKGAGGGGGTLLFSKNEFQVSIWISGASKQLTCSEMDTINCFFMITSISWAGPYDCFTSARLGHVNFKD